MHNVHGALQDINLSSWPHSTMLAYCTAAVMCPPEALRLLPGRRQIQPQGVDLSLGCLQLLLAVLGQRLLQLGLDCLKPGLCSLTPAGPEIPLSELP